MEKDSFFTQLDYTNANFHSRIHCIASMDIQSRDFEGDHQGNRRIYGFHIRPRVLRIGRDRHCLAVSHGTLSNCMFLSKRRAR